MKLFTYGTLQQGYWNNHLLSGATYLGEAVTEKPYLLWQAGFPIASHNQDYSLSNGLPMLPVMGQVFEVDEGQLCRCDRLEGHPDWYKREVIKVKVNNSWVDSFIYEQNDYVGRHLCNVLDNRYYQWVG